MKRNLKKKMDIEPTKSFEEFAKEIKNVPVNERYEIVSIYGDCIWNIFSNNHTVFNKKQESYDLGSWRGSGSSIADVITKLNLVPDYIFDYLDFYMGNFIADKRADLTPVYEFIFKQLKTRNLNWEFSFPRMGMVDFSGQENAVDDMEHYNPSDSLQKQFKDKQKRDELHKLQQQLDSIYKEEYKKARSSNPAQEVIAYYNVYGCWPKGHPLAET